MYWTPAFLMELNHKESYIWFLKSQILMNLLKLSGHPSSGGFQIPGDIQPAQPSWLHSIPMTKTFPAPLQGAVKSCCLWLLQLLFWIARIVAMFSFSDTLLRNWVTCQQMCSPLQGTYLLLSTPCSSVTLLHWCNSPVMSFLTLPGMGRSLKAVLSVLQPSSLFQQFAGIDTKSGFLTFGQTRSKKVNLLDRRAIHPLSGLNRV